VVVYSDGVTDARNVREVLYNAPRLLRRLADFKGGPAATCQAIVQDLREFSAGHHQDDDITLVCFGSLARLS
jgi:sigma-B regulation protein RsbU (phosphoserine phosphatase)